MQVDLAELRKRPAHDEWDDTTNFYYRAVAISVEERDAIVEELETLRREKEAAEQRVKELEADNHEWEDAARDIAKGEAEAELKWGKLQGIAERLAGAARAYRMAGEDGKFQAEYQLQCAENDLREILPEVRDAQSRD